MLCNGRQRDAAKIFIIHPGDEIPNDVGRDIRGKGSEGLKEFLAVGVNPGAVSIAQDHSLCAVNADSIMPPLQDVEKGTLFHPPAPCAWERTFHRVASRIGAVEDAEGRVLTRRGWAGVNNDLFEHPAGIGLLRRS